MSNICGSTSLRSNDLSSLKKEFNFIRRYVCQALQGGGSGGIDSPDRINGTATSDVTANLNGHLLSIDSGVIQYASDYSASYTSRSLVDKGYIDSVSLVINFTGPINGQSLIYNDGELINKTFVSANVIPELSSDPGEGNLYINTSTHKLRWKDTAAGNWYEANFDNIYPVGQTAIIFNTTSGSVVESPAGTWTFGGAAQAVASGQPLPLGNGRVTWEMSSNIADVGGMVIGLSSSAVVQAYTSFDYGMFAAGSNFYAVHLGSNELLGTYPGTITHFRIDINGGVAIAQYSSDGVNFTNGYTFLVSPSTTLYVHMDNLGGGGQFVTNIVGVGF